jgi:uncharacterized surface protein with fasciclin (FAS1) repeats
MLISPLLALLVASSAVAQNQNASSFFPDLMGALKVFGVNKLASFVQNISDTSIGQQLLRDLPNGNKTIFAPVDHAFNGKPPSNITDKNVLAAIFSYHIVTGSFDANSFAHAPNHTLLRTAMNSSLLVNLEAGRGQMLSLSNVNGTVHILGQNTQVQILNSTTVNNTVVHVVNAVIDPPAPLEDVLDSRNLSQLVGAATAANLVSQLRDAHGITIFAPTNDAFTTALRNAGASGQNLTADSNLITTVLKNHLINGTSVYAGQFSSGNWTSAAGEPLKFATNSSGIFVTNGNATARVVESDVLTSNGVVHVIDNVLLNMQSNSSAASSAFQSATPEAAANPTPTSPITSTGNSGANNGSGSNGGNGGNNGNGNNTNTGAALGLRPSTVSFLFVLLVVSFL